MSYRNLRAAMVECLLQNCSENGLRPYLWVSVDECCIVPTEYVQDGMIVFDLDEEAVRDIELNDECIAFVACFDDNSPMHVVVPLNRVAHAAAAEEPAQGASFMVTETPVGLRERILGKPSRTDSAAPRRPMRIK